MFYDGFCTFVRFHSTSGNNLTWLENNSSEGFSARAVGAASFGQSVFAADVDSDGDTDVLSASNQDSKVAWYENNGAQVFTEHVISASDRGAFAVFAADYDGDGDIDVLSSAVGDGELVLHVNDGSQNFTKRVIADGLTNARRVFASDVDGDGDLDVLAASSTVGSPVSWFENLGAQPPTATFDNAPGGEGGSDRGAFASVNPDLGGNQRLSDDGTLTPLNLTVAQNDDAFPLASLPVGSVVAVVGRRVEVLQDEGHLASRTEGGRAVDREHGLEGPLGAGPENPAFGTAPRARDAEPLRDSLRNRPASMFSRCGRLPDEALVARR